MDVKYIDANGLRFAYLEEGSGPLVLLIHGFPDTAHTWDHVIPKIAAKGYRVVAPFTRGYYPTAAPAKDADGETLALDALALIKAFGQSSAIVVGHDWGATAAYGSAAIDPASVTKLFVVGIPHPTTVRIRPALAWGVRHFGLYKLPGAERRFSEHNFAALRKIYRRWSPTWHPEPEEFTHIRESFSHPESLHAAFGYYRQLSFLPPYYMKTKITVPTVVFAGLDDAIVSPEDYYRAEKMFSNGYTVEEVPGGHFLHREYPDIFAEKLLKHL
jgi:pimeloyl-ACP methyl ester carboxylesterase